MHCDYGGLLRFHGGLMGSSLYRSFATYTATVVFGYIM